MALILLLMQRMEPLLLREQSLRPFRRMKMQRMRRGLRKQLWLRLLRPFRMWLPRRRQNAQCSGLASPWTLLEEPSSTGADPQNYAISLTLSCDIPCFPCLCQETSCNIFANAAVTQWQAKPLTALVLNTPTYLAEGNIILWKGAASKPSSA